MSISFVCYDQIAPTMATASVKILRHFTTDVRSEVFSARSRLRGEVREARATAQQFESLKRSPICKNLCLSHTRVDGKTRRGQIA